MAVGINVRVSNVYSLGYPHLGGPINKYVTHGGIKSIQYISGSASFMVDSTKVYSTSKSTMSSYRFLSQ